MYAAAFVPDSLNRGSSCRFYTVSSYTPNSRREHCRLCVESLEKTERDCSVFYKYNFNHAVNIGPGSFTLIRLQGPLLVWNGWQLGGVSCVGSWTLTPVSQNSLAKCFCLLVLCFIPVLGDLTGTGPVPTFLCCLTTVSSSVTGLKGYLNFQK